MKKRTLILTVQGAMLSAALLVVWNLSYQASEKSTSPLSSPNHPAPPVRVQLTAWIPRRQIVDKPVEMFFRVKNTGAPIKALVLRFRGLGNWAVQSQTDTSEHEIKRIDVLGKGSVWDYGGLLHGQIVLVGFSVTPITPGNSTIVLSAYAADRMNREIQGSHISWRVHVSPATIHKQRKKAAGLLRRLSRSRQMSERHGV